MKQKSLKSQSESGADPKSVFGFPSADVASMDVMKVSKTFPNLDDASKATDLTVKAITGMQSSDYPQSMLSSQMIACHNLVLTFLARAATDDRQSAVEMNATTAARLMDIFLRQMAMQNKLRGNDQQKMEIRHLHVHEGAQAVVGQLQVGGGEKSNRD